MASLLFLLPQIHRTWYKEGKRIATDLIREYEDDFLDPRHSRAKVPERFKPSVQIQLETVMQYTVGQLNEILTVDFQKQNAEKASTPEYKFCVAVAFMSELEGNRQS